MEDGNVLHPRSETDAPGRALLGWACLVAGLGAAPGLAQPTVMWIEEDWEAVLNEPTEDLTAPQNPIISVKVDDVDAAYADALQRGYEIVHPLTVEEWGVRRFFVRAPDGNVINIVQHHE